MANAFDVQAMTESLGAISGAEYVHADGEMLRIAPANTEEIAAVLRFANENGIAVSALGGGTKRNWGNQGGFSLAVETLRLNTVREHPWQDMTCTVEAGCAWSAMQVALAAHGQFVALDPLWPDRATVGGIVATNDSGSLRLRYGSLRDLVIGMTIVLADGTIARSGGKVVKNVAGYDLHKLMIGAFGTLGIITEVTFRLHAIPRHTQCFTVSAPDAEPLGQLLLKIIGSNLSTQSLQLRGGDGDFKLDLRLAALPEVLQDQGGAFVALAADLGLNVSAPETAAWSAREELFKQSESFVVKATVLPTEIARFAADVCALGGVSVTQSVGIMTAAISAAASGQILDLRRKLEAVRGSLTILQQPAGASLSAWGTAPDTLPLMQELKQRFDRNRILNPGRFLGGI